MTLRRQAADRMRRWADRLDYSGAPKLTHWTFTFERGRGIVFREDGKGCRVAYLGDEDYEKAHAESATAAADAARAVAVQHAVDGIQAWGNAYIRAAAKAFAPLMNHANP